MNINRESARKVARKLFTIKPQKVNFYGDPNTGFIEGNLVGEYPSTGYEFICSESDGSWSGWGQELCESNKELNNLFANVWNDTGSDWIEELEQRWNEFSE